MPGGLLKEFRSKKEAQLRASWRFHPNLEVVSYEWLAHPDHADWLEQYKPDWIFCDEAHKMGGFKSEKRKRSSTLVKRLLGYIDRGDVPCAFASGSFFTSGFESYAHLAHYATRKAPEGPVLAKNRDAHALIADAVDRDGGAHAARKCGAVLGGKYSKPDEVREAIKARLKAHSACLVSEDCFDEVLLKIEFAKARHCPIIAEAFNRLRKFGELPDGFVLGEGFNDDGSAARQLAWGYYYDWEPRPTEAFYSARKAYMKKVEKLISSGKCDSEGTAKRLLRDSAELAAWDTERTSYSGIQRANWISRARLDDVIAWGKTHPDGLIWTGWFLELGRELARLTGWPCYGRGGLDDNKRPVADHPRGVPALVSTQANYTGRDRLQYRFSEVLVLDPAASGAITEQRIGRVMRQGQTSPVHETWLMACHENLQATHSALADAKAIQAQLNPQLLLNAEMLVPKIKGFGHGPLWVKDEYT
jgi:hypothetical protein